MDKYNRSKILKELFSQGVTVEEAIQKCLQLGDKNEACLIYSAKRIKREMSKVTANA
jgi:hypothetical protein